MVAHLAPRGSMTLKNLIKDRENLAVYPVKDGEN